jgi:hypothetical protein
VCVALQNAATFEVIAARTVAEAEQPKNLTADFKDFADMKKYHTGFVDSWFN